MVPALQNSRTSNEKEASNSINVAEEVLKRMKGTQAEREQ